MKYQMKAACGVVLATALLVGCASSTDADNSGDISAADVNAGDAYSNAQDAGQNGAGGFTDQDDAAVLETVFYFDFDQATMTADTRRAVDAQVARLKSTTGPIRLEGHADERGTREYNIALGERRANAVADYMAIQGIRRYRIETVSYGEERPVILGQNDGAYGKNRRVELK